MPSRDLRTGSLGTALGGLMEEAVLKQHIRVSHAPRHSWAGRKPFLCTVGEPCPQKHAVGNFRDFQWDMAVRRPNRPLLRGLWLCVQMWWWCPKFPAVLFPHGLHSLWGKPGRGWSPSRVFSFYLQDGIFHGQNYLDTIAIRNNWPLNRIKTKALRPLKGIDTASEAKWKSGNFNFSSYPTAFSQVQTKTNLLLLLEIINITSGFFFCSRTYHKVLHSILSKDISHNNLPEILVSAGTFSFAAYQQK